jgi:hypothetical protein
MLSVGFTFFGFSVLVDWDMADAFARISDCCISFFGIISGKEDIFLMDGEELHHS